MASVPDYQSRKQRESVYRIIGCNREAAEILYSVGFWDVDERDSAGLSPLAALVAPFPQTYSGRYQVRNVFESFTRFVAMCDWFYAKGASLILRGGPDVRAPLQRVAEGIGQSLARIMATYAEWQLSEESLQQHFDDHVKMHGLQSPVIQEIFKDRYHDSRQDSCPGQNCLLLQILLDALLKNVWHLGTMMTRVFLFMQLINTDVHPEGGLVHHLTPIVIRSLVFASMGVRCSNNGVEGRLALDLVDTLIRVFLHHGKPLLIFLLDDFESLVTPIVGAPNSDAMEDSIRQLSETTML